MHRDSSPLQSGRHGGGRITSPLAWRALIETPALGDHILFWSPDSAPSDAIINVCPRRSPPKCTHGNRLAERRTRESAMGAPTRPTMRRIVVIRSGLRRRLPRVVALMGR